MTDPTDRAASLLQALDDEQRAVATTFGRPVAVLAGAGTGKTRAITHRIAYGSLTGAYNPRAVLAVTFTTRAAGEMRGRLAALGVEGAQARTFHSAALRQASYFWPRAYGSALPPIVDNQFGLVAEAAGRLRLPTDVATIRDLSAEVSWTKVTNVLPEGYAALARQQNRSVANLEPDQVVRLITAYDALKRERGRIDLDDIVLCAAALLSEHDDIATEIRRTYRHLVVDEYQDVSPLQQRLLDLWVGRTGDLCVVGDPAQTIHTFAGARAEYLLTFERHHPGAQVIELVRDYRSTPEVVSVANAVLAPSNERRVVLRAQQPPGPAAVFHEAATEADEAAEIAAWLQARNAEGVAWRDMAVLFRINAQSPPIELALAEHKIPYQVRGADRFYERAEVRQVLAGLRAEQRNDPEGDGIEALARLLQALGWTTEPPRGAGRVRERWESQTALSDLATQFAAEAEEPPTVADLSDELQRRADIEHAPPGAGVTVSTLHSAKGLEWEAVALLGIHEGGVPFVLATTPAQVAEERRLLYVGVTRARRHLHISWSRSRTGNGSRGPSRFLNGLVSSATAGRASVPARTRAKKRAPLATTCRVCGGDLSTTAERTLGRHEDCEPSYDEAVLAELKAWRKEQAAEQKVPAYCVFTDATLTAIAEAAPADRQGLSMVSGVGAAKLEKFADPVLEILSAKR